MKPIESHKLSEMSRGNYLPGSFYLGLQPVLTKRILKAGAIGFGGGAALIPVLGGNSR